MRAARVLGRLAMWSLVAALIASCSTGPAPIIQPEPVFQESGEAESAEAELEAPKPVVYSVRSGDTLSEIAQKFGMPLDELALQNGLRPPYMLNIGQKIVVSGGSGSVDQAQLVQSAREAMETSLAPAGRSVGSSVGSEWIWPAQGVVAQSFSSSHRGIDISGKLGDRILAARDGTVLAVQKDMPSFGHMVILQHSDSYLSFYGHIRDFLVRVGDEVEQGQAIAEMGDSGTDRVQLHFEVRFQGRSIDPLEKLPR